MAGLEQRLDPLGQPYWVPIGSPQIVGPLLPMPSLAPGEQVIVMQTPSQKKARKGDAEWDPQALLYFWKEGALRLVPALAFLLFKPSFALQFLFTINIYIVEKYAQDMVHQKKKATLAMCLGHERVLQEGLLQ